MFFRLEKCSKIGCRRGQAMVEYVVAFAGLVVVVSLMIGFIGLVQRYGVRSERLVAAEYP